MLSQRRVACSIAALFFVAACGRTELDQPVDDDGGSTAGTGGSGIGTGGHGGDGGHAGTGGAAGNAMGRAGAGGNATGRAGATGASGTGGTGGQPPPVPIPCGGTTCQPATQACCIQPGGGAMCINAGATCPGGASIGCLEGGA